MKEGVKKAESCWADKNEGVTPTAPTFSAQKSCQNIAALGMPGLACMHLQRRVALKRHSVPQNTLPPIFDKSFGKLLAAPISDIFLGPYPAKDYSRKSRICSGEPSN